MSLTDCMGYFLGEILCGYCLIDIITDLEGGGGGERQTDRQIERQKDRGRERERGGGGGGETDRQTDREPSFKGRWYGDCALSRRLVHVHVRRTTERIPPPPPTRPPLSLSLSLCLATP